MPNSYIEEFFISIGFDTKKVKKEAKEIDKILDGLAGKKRKQASDEVKEVKKKEKAEKKRYSTQRKSEADNFKHFLKNEKGKQQAIKKTAAVQQQSRIKQAVASITAGTGAGKAKASASVFSQAFAQEDAAKKVEKIKDEKARKRFIDRKQRRAKLNQMRQKAAEKEAVVAKKALMERLAIHKRNKAVIGREQTSTLDFSKRGQALKGSAQFRSISDRGKRADISARIDKAVTEKNVHALRELKREITAVGRESTTTARKMKKLNTVQKGLNDSTRNMIRSYASVFALFQGTVAIKRVGQDFQGMQAAMLAASGSAPEAAKDIQFINGMVDEMGLNLKDTTDAFVKFKFAAKGKMDQTQIEELFTSVSMFGTALKVAPEDMKRAQRALSQIMSKGVVMSEELKSQLGDALPG